MSDLTIRAATADDVVGLRDCEQGVVSAERPMNDDLNPGLIQYYDIEALIASADSEMLVVESAGKIVGCGHATIKQSADYFFHDRHAYLGLLYVAPDQRGKGLIQRVMDALVAWSRSKGVTSYYLDVYPQNASAIRAYEKYGFRPNMMEMKLHDD